MFSSPSYAEGGKCIQDCLTKHRSPFRTSHFVISLYLVSKTLSIFVVPGFSTVTPRRAATKIPFFSISKREKPWKSEKATFDISDSFTSRFNEWGNISVYEVQ